MLPEILGFEDDVLATDVGSIEFIVTYEDKTKADTCFGVRQMFLVNYLP